MDERLKKLLEWLQGNQEGNPWAKKMPFYPWGEKGVLPRKPGRKPPGYHNLPEKYPEGFDPFGPYLWPPRRKQPDWGKFPKKPYRPPSGTHEMPGIPDTEGRPARPPGWNNLPERVEEPEWWREKFPFFPKWGDKGIKPVPGTLPGPWDKFPRRKFDGNKEDFFQLLKDAQAGSAMPKYHSGMGKNIRDLSTEMATDPLSYVPGRRISDLPLRSATQGDSMSDHLAATYGEDSPEFKRHEAQDAGIELPKGQDWITKMHDIQSAYFTGADFGYEEFWPQRLSVTNEMIDMFMAVPEEALQYAMDNPTDAVLQEFEEYYGFPLNVNDPDMQKYFEDSKKKRPRG